MAVGVVSPSSPPSQAAQRNNNRNNNNNNATATTTIAEEDRVILPPPSASNPWPALGAALRIDQQEQLLELLRQDPTTTTSTAASAAASSSGTTPRFRQLLVFATERLRTVLLRQALTDPQQRVWKNKKKNWDTADSFPFPTDLGNSILGTKVLLSRSHHHSVDGDASAGGGTNPDWTNFHYYDQHQISNSASTATATPQVSTSTSSSSSGDTSFSSSSFSALQSPFGDDQDWNDAILWAAEGKLDVVTYFLHTHTLEHTKAAIHRFQKSFRQARASAVAAAASLLTTTSSGALLGGSSSHGSTLTTSATPSHHLIHHRFVYIPQMTALVQQLLLQSGLSSHPNVSFVALQLDLFPLETDVLSTEYHGGLRDAVAVEMTPSNFITSTARSILKLQDIVGTIPRIQAYGPLGEEVLRKMLHMTVDEYLASGGQNNNNNNNSNNNSSPQGDGSSNRIPEPESGVAALILMDRRVDWVTPMVTPLTYEGLLDDLLGIEAGFLHIPLSLINPPEADNNTTTAAAASAEAGKNKKTKADGAVEDFNERIALGVNGSDSLYAEVRNQHVEKFGSFLQNQAIALRQSHAEFTAHGKKKDLTEIHQFVKQIPIFAQNLRSLTNHINLAELVKKTTEDVVFRERWQTERSILEGESCYDILDDLVASQYPPFAFFRLLCLQSVCSGGIKSSRLDSLKRDVVQTYGYEYLFVLHNLEQAGLLRRREGLWMDSASSFATLRKLLILIHPEVNTVDPDDVAYVSSGYAPMSVRLIQTAVKGWTGREEILRELPGRALDIYQTMPPQDLATSLQITPNQPLGATVVPKSSSGSKSSSSKKPILAIFYVGGITYMEIAALRFLSQRPGFPYHILILTTEILNGSTLLRSMR
ncbi:hypothetical protein ACA910_020137 [Epithemia clementina (nom. ined.)]